MQATSSNEDATAVAQPIVIVGGGNVGAALASGLTATDHDVVIAVRAPEDPKHEPMRQRVPVVPMDNAASNGPTVILAVPALAIADVVGALGLEQGHLVIDATNAVGIAVPEGHPTMADFVASLVPDGVQVAKAFNTIGAEHLATGTVDGTPAFLPIAGDHDARRVAAQVGSRLGFDVADLGNRTAFGLIESHAQLWIHLAFTRGWGREFGFTVHRT